MPRERQTDAPQGRRQASQRRRRTQKQAEANLLRLMADETPTAALAERLDAL
jgi:hypothetical protein